MSKHNWLSTKETPRISGLQDPRLEAGADSRAWDKIKSVGSAATAQEMELFQETRDSGIVYIPATPDSELGPYNSYI